MVAILEDTLLKKKTDSFWTQKPSAVTQKLNNTCLSRVLTDVDVLSSVTQLYHLTMNLKETGFTCILSGMFNVLIMAQLLGKIFCWINFTIGKIKGQRFSQGCICSECETRHIGFSDLSAGNTSYIWEKRSQLSSEEETYPSFCQLTGPVGFLCSSEHFRFQQAL